MPTTRKKVIKTVYKNEDDSEPEESGDFSDSGSDAKITDHSSSEDQSEEDQAVSSGEEFEEEEEPKKTNSKQKKPVARRKELYAKSFVNKIRNESQLGGEGAPAFSVKDLTDSDKLLPSFLNLSESDSSEDESPRKPSTTPAHTTNTSHTSANGPDSDHESKTEYHDVWSKNEPDNSEEIAQKTFKDLEIHKTNIEQTKASILNYTAKSSNQAAFDVKDLLAQGEEVLPGPVENKKKSKKKKVHNDSDSDLEDWEEVKESKTLPASGLQVVVDFPNAVTKRAKKLDLEMMMKRKMNRVKKEYQVYMHKVHVLCWLGHGNYVSSVLNDQEIMSAVLSLVPSKECYPGERVDVKYIEQVTKWFNNKLTFKQDKHEHKFKPKAPPLKDIILKEIKSKVVSTKKYKVFIFVSMLRALGLQCRVMFNLVTLPIRPPSSELCSLSTKVKDENKKDETKKEDTKKSKSTKKSTSKKNLKENISQVDGNDDSDIMQVDGTDDRDFDIMQIDGNDDGNVATPKGRKTRLTRSKKVIENKDQEDDNVSPPKRAKKDPVANPPKSSDNTVTQTRKRNRKSSEEVAKPQETKATIKNDSSKNVSPSKEDVINEKFPSKPKLRLTRSTTKNDTAKSSQQNNKNKTQDKQDTPNIIVTDENDEAVSSAFLENSGSAVVKPRRGTRVQTANSKSTQNDKSSGDNDKPQTASKTRSKSSKNVSPSPRTLSLNRRPPAESVKEDVTSEKSPLKPKSHQSRSTTKNDTAKNSHQNTKNKIQDKQDTPNITVTDENDKAVSKAFFENASSAVTVKPRNRTRAKTANPKSTKNDKSSGDIDKPQTASKTRSKSSTVEKSKYFNDTEKTPVGSKKSKKPSKVKVDPEDHLRVSHLDMLVNSKSPSKSDVKADLIAIMKTHKSEAIVSKSRKSVKGKKASKGDSDYEPDAVSDEDFKPTKISPKPGSSRKIDRRVISTDDEAPKDKTDVWVEVFVEELEQWIAVDVIKGKVHCTNEIYSRATHPVCYVVGWDNNNYLKDLTCRYVPHWNTVTRKLRAEPVWWDQAISPWRGPRSARDKEEDEQLDRMQLDAPLPKSIAEYKNHPLYVLKRHLLKYEALYPPDAATLGFVRNEPVYARECVYVCRSRDTWLKQAKVVKLGEKPYKIVKANPKWDRLSNKVVKSDSLLDIFGPWQTQDYEPPQAENGMVPRNAYGNVELFKDCMLPKGTVHIKLPGLNKVARKLNIDCAPAMTGFDGSGGWSYPVYDGFVVCKEFEEVITEAWLQDQEDQERREREKTEARVYGNWKRLIRGLMIKERLKLKYGFEDPRTSATSNAKKSKGPRLVVKK